MYPLYSIIPTVKCVAPSDNCDIVSLSIHFNGLPVVVGDFARRVVAIISFALVLHCGLPSFSLSYIYIITYARAFVKYFLKNFLRQKASISACSLPLQKGKYRCGEGKDNIKNLALSRQLAIIVATTKIRIEAYFVVAFLVVIVLSH